MEQARQCSIEPTGATQGASLWEWGLAVLALGVVVLVEQALDAAGTGRLTHHMVIDLLLMTLAAAPLARLWLRIGAGTPGQTGSLAAAAALQLALLSAWHAPALREATIAHPVLHLVMQASLLAAAIWFWVIVLTRRGSDRWRAILALLFTGALVCLLGMLLVVAPSVLHAFGTAAAGDPESLADQQLAGLLMLGAGPLFYVAAGVAVSVCWLTALARGPREPAEAVGRGAGRWWSRRRADVPGAETSALDLNARWS